MSINKVYSKGLAYVYICSCDCSCGIVSVTCGQYQICIYTYCTHSWKVSYLEKHMQCMICLQTMSIHSYKEHRKTSVEFCLLVPMYSPTAYYI